MNMDGHPPFPCNVGKTTSNVLVPSFHLISQLVHGCSSTQKKLSYGIWYIPHTNCLAVSNPHETNVFVSWDHQPNIYMFIYVSQTMSHHQPSSWLPSSQLYNMFWHHLLVVENRPIFGAEISGRSQACGSLTIFGVPFCLEFFRAVFAGDSPRILMN